MVVDVEEVNILNTLILYSTQITTWSKTPNALESAIAHPIPRLKSPKKEKKKTAGEYVNR